MTLVWIVLSALVAAAFAQGKSTATAVFGRYSPPRPGDRISVTPTTAIIDESNVITLEFRLSNPIICEDPHAYCAVMVLVTNNNPRDIALSACHVEWTRDEWQQVRTSKCSSSPIEVDRLACGADVLTVSVCHCSRGDRR